MPHILIIAAIKEEIQPLLQHFDFKQQAEHETPTFVNEQNKQKRTLIISGMGKKHATKSLKHALTHMQPDYILNPGFAGGLNPELNPGDAFISRKICGAGNPDEFIEPYQFDSVPDDVGTGRMLYTAEQLIDSPAAKQACFKKTQCDAVDMESFHLAKLAQEKKVPFISLRAISDPASMALPKEVASWVREDGSPDMTKAMSYVASHPMMAPKLMKINGFAKKAATALTESIAETLKAIPSRIEKARQ